MPQAQPSSALIESISVTGTYPTFDIELTPHDCGYDFPLFTAGPGLVSKTGRSVLNVCPPPLPPLPRASDPYCTMKQRYTDIEIRLASKKICLGKKVLWYFSNLSCKAGILNTPKRHSFPDNSLRSWEWSSLRKRQSSCEQHREKTTLELKFVENPTCLWIQWGPKLTSRNEISVSLKPKSKTCNAFFLESTSCANLPYWTIHWFCFLQWFLVLRASWTPMSANSD